ncbi:MAG: hypothetical protein E7290_15055 [Lachnospiraceae bacterium]|nr:hypothetical protein [Lachnospiraceae bacterium]
MSLFVYVLADIIHLVKIIVLCDVLFEFQRREIWHNRVLFGCIGIIASILSITIYTYDNEAVETLGYIVAIIVLLSILYNEKVHSVANREKETKKFRHDLRSHMELISNLAKNREYEKIDSYLEKMNIKIDSFGNIITVQNGIVDAIINQYYDVNNILMHKHTK